MQQAAQTQARIDAQREAERQAAADAAAAEHRLGPFMQGQLAIAKSKPSRSVSPDEGQLQHYASSTTTTTAAAPPSEMNRLTTDFSRLNLGDDEDDLEYRMRNLSLKKKGKGKRKGGKKTRKQRRKH
jgi:hypothetical protein